MSMQLKPERTDESLQGGRIQRLASTSSANSDPRPSEIDHRAGGIASTLSSTSSSEWGSSWTSTESESSVTRTLRFYSSVETIRDDSSNDQEHHATHQFGRPLGLTPTEESISNDAAPSHSGSESFGPSRPELSISTVFSVDNQPQAVEYSPTEVSDSPPHSPTEYVLQPSGMTISAEFLSPLPELSFYSLSPEMREGYFEGDPYVRRGTIRHDSVVCVKCGERVILDKGIPFLPRRWFVHRYIHCPVLNPKDASQSQRSYYDEKDAYDGAGASQSGDLQ